MTQYIASQNGDKVEVRSNNLAHLASGYYSGLRKISASADYAVLYFYGGKIEVRDKNLKYISSWHQ